MPITLGSYTFDERLTSVTEKLEEVGGRDERRITIKGMIVGKETTQEIHDELDLILAAASAQDYSTELAIRSSRRLMVRRDGFVRDVRGESLTGGFTLELNALYPYEESDSETQLVWPVFLSGDTLPVAPGGNAVTDMKFTLTPSLDMVNPYFTDGLNKFLYNGTVTGGSTLVIDGVNRTVSLNGDDALAYTVGTFPRLDPAGTTLLFGCNAGFGQSGTVLIDFRARWF